MNVGPQIRLPTYFAVVVAILVAWAGVALADHIERPVSFEVSSRDRAEAQLLANQIAALPPSVRPEEASQLALCAYATVSQLRKQYRMFGTPIFNNFLVHWGVKKRGYCFQWAEDLLVALEVVVMPREAAQRARNVGGDGGFLGNDEGLGQNFRDGAKRTQILL